MSHSKQTGASLIIVLVVLMILLLGALSMARVNESTTLIAGNIAFKNSSMQASESGIAEAFARLATVVDDDTDQDGWYFATLRGDDAAGLPSGLNWKNAAKVTVGPFTASYVIERQCIGTTPVTDMNAQCLIRKLPSIGSAKAGMEAFDMAVSKQYRITTFVTGPKDTNTFVQTMVVR